jgi:RimJ/RimL family protein N-acetyltransferase
VGITGTFTDSDDPTGGTVGFGMSYLSPEYRGRGFASLFYETRFAWVRARPHFRRVIVAHRESNEPSRRTIEKFGFQRTESIPHHWPDGTDDDDVCYELLLDEPVAAP